MSNFDSEVAKIHREKLRRIFWLIARCGIFLAAAYLFGMGIGQVIIWDLNARGGM